MSARILVFVPWYLPGHMGGGPIRTIVNLVERLGHEFEFLIVTGDRDSNNSVPYPGVRIDAWNDVGKARVYYASRKALSFSGIARILRETPHDLLYLNSFFHPRFSLTPLLARRFSAGLKTSVLLAPKGEFSVGAYRIKRWKKAPFTWLMRAMGLLDDVYWHASTTHEAIDILRVALPSADRIGVACDLLALPEVMPITGAMAFQSDTSDEPVVQPLRVCFLSRISPMKNLAFALATLRNLTIAVEFNLYGPVEDKNYWRQCETSIAQLPANVKVNCHGSVRNEQVQEVISGHDVFFLPTLGENFGHVILEAWSAGVPVLISDQTPWRDLEKKGIGWDVPLEQPGKFLEILEIAATMNSQARHEMSVNCLEFAREVATNKHDVEMNRRIFMDHFAARDSLADFNEGTKP